MRPYKKIKLTGTPPSDISKQMSKVKYVKKEKFGEVYSTSLIYTLLNSRWGRVLLAFLIWIVIYFFFIFPSISTQSNSFKEIIENTLNHNWTYLLLPSSLIAFLSKRKN